MQRKSRHYLFPQPLPARQSKWLAEYQLPLFLAQIKALSWQSFCSQERRQKEGKSLKGVWGTVSCQNPGTASLWHLKEYWWHKPSAVNRGGSAISKGQQFMPDSPAAQNSSTSSLHLASTDIAKDSMPDSAKRRIKPKGKKTLGRTSLFLSELCCLRIKCSRFKWTLAE